MFSRQLYRPLFSSLIICTLFCQILSVSASAAVKPGTPTTETAGDTSFKQGRDLLRRNRADQAMPLLEAALEAYRQGGDQLGSAAVLDALGDIYARQGQYASALQQYTAAQKIFADKLAQGGPKQKDAATLANRALLLAKIAETNYLAGNLDAARAAFAQVSGQDAKHNNAPSLGSDSLGDSTAASAINNKGNGSGSLPTARITFATFSAALPALACTGLNPNNKNSDSNSDSADNNSAAGGGAQNMGHAPKKLDGIGRMDLRVVDQDGNPVKNVKSRLSTKRPNGLNCDCWSATDALGRAVMNPIHVGEKLHLELKADGFQPQDILVNPDDMAAPYKVVMLAKGAVKAAAAGTQTASQSASQPAAASSAAPGSCFDLLRLFSAYGNAELGLGRADFANRDFDAAQSHYLNVLTVADAKKSTGQTGAARLFRAVARTSLGDIAFEQGRFADAVKNYTDAVNGAREDNRLELLWGAQRGLGRALLAQSAAETDPQAAVRLREEGLRGYRGALATIETLFAGSLRADEARAGFLAATSDVFAEAAGAFAELALNNAGPAPPAVNQARMAHAVSTTPADNGTTLNGQAFNYAVEAFKITEQGRARALLDMLGEARAEITAGVSAELLTRRQDNLARQQEIADVLTGITLSTTTPPKQTVPELEIELERLTTESNALENQLRVGSPRYAALTKTQPLTLPEVQQQVLDANTVLLEYALGKQRSYLWAATKSGLTLYRLPARKVIEEQTMALREQLIPAGARRSLTGLDAGGEQRGLLGNNATAQDDGRGLKLGGTMNTPQNVSAYAKAAAALYQSVMAPAVAVTSDKRLLIVADGVLNYVPFEALVSNPDGTDYSSLPYLIKTNEIVYAPSASVIGAIRQQAARNASTAVTTTPAAAAANRSVLLVADPVFDQGDARAGGAVPKNSVSDATRRMAFKSALGDVTSLPLASVKLIRLNGTRSEAEQIAQLARSSGGSADIWLDLDASEANVNARQLDNYRVLHFATHGLLDAARPQFTGLALSLVGEGDADGFLRVGEVFNLKLGAPLVMLSACETGLGKEKRGEGVIGLTRAFMYAGAPTVGVSLWSVADRSTAELMPDFYKRLLAGTQGVNASMVAGAPAALRAAQQQMIDGRKFSAPFYWAPFVLVGDWR